MRIAKLVGIVTPAADSPSIIASAWRHLCTPTVWLHDGHTSVRYVLVILYKSAVMHLQLLAAGEQATVQGKLPESSCSGCMLQAPVQPSCSVARNTVVSE